MREILGKGNIELRAELALQGIVIQLLDKENMEYALDYIAKAINCTEMTGAEIYAEATKYIDPKETEPVGLSCSTLFGGEMRVVNIIFKDKGKSLKLDDPNGVICHVHNFDAPDCSELGYCFFERRSKTSSQYHRIA